MTTTNDLLITLAAFLAASATAGCATADSSDSAEDQPAHVSDEHRRDAGSSLYDGGANDREDPPGRASSANPGGSDIEPARDGGAAPVRDPGQRCGKWGQICCGQPGDGVCDLNNLCLQFDNWCSPRFTTPCTSTAQCPAGLVCELNYCLSCGVIGHRCCAGGTCNDEGATCNSVHRCQSP